MSAGSPLNTDRRGFVGRLSAIAAALGLGSAPETLAAAPRRATGVSAAPEFEAWLDGITGKHKQVFDATSVNDGFPSGYLRTWMNTTRDTYNLTDKDLSGVLVVRHAGAILALTSPIWAKYKLGEMFKVNDPKTKAPAVRNPYAFVKPGELMWDDMAMDKVLARGAKVAVCGVAMTVFSGMAADAAKADKQAVYKEWVAGLIPGIVIAPSGVLAVHRAQEKGCTYCSAG
jgi:intracellular sulfur oxidation DsrE/DsrF family protein